jgi:hypothetical protein
MSTQNDKLDFSQPTGDNNQMSFYAEQQRSKLFPRNDFNTKNQYGPTNKDALSDGDGMGRGTGGFLDVNNDKIGNSADIMDRVDNIKINKYNYKTPYTTPTP